MVDTAFSGGTLVFATAVGVKAGCAIGTVVPGIGNIIGTGVGIVVGVALFFVTDVLNIEGKTIREHSKEEIADGLNIK